MMEQKNIVVYVTYNLLKKIDKNNNIWEYDPNNSKRIKETLSNDAWTEFNPANDKMMKRKNIDGFLEEFDENEKKIKKTQYQSDKKIFIK
ncbi:hypothetical protein C6B37_02580 [Candidatus Phytoplasma phoenicium]|uniref:Uncharacterized protein n=1 Tax=Candidatus Phytoplasma phoenicium TaxID=198422 RepID=A0A2S8NSZ9_9MOLU|nr:hypothetical protein C6B37_02580 [Candidatus Phytoplasma phoenicium]